SFVPERRNWDTDRSVAAAAAVGLAPHALGDDADLLNTGAASRVDDADDVTVAERRVADDEHRLFLARLEDVPQPALELLDWHDLLVHGDDAIGAVVEHDLLVVDLLRRGFRLERQVDVHALLGELQG